MVHTTEVCLFKAYLRTFEPYVNMFEGIKVIEDLFKDTSAIYA